MRKLIVCCVAVSAALALSASSAMGAVVVRSSATGNDCPAVAVSGNTVSGGCLIAGVTGTVTVNWGEYPQKCNVAFDMRVSKSGTFYTSNPSLGSCLGNPGPLYKECENASGVGNPWPGSLQQSGTAVTAIMTMCHDLIPWPGNEYTAPNVPFSVTLHANKNLSQMTQTGPGSQTWSGPWGEYTAYYNNFSNGLFSNVNNDQVEILLK